MIATGEVLEPRVNSNIGTKAIEFESPSSVRYSGMEPLN